MRRVLLAVAGAATLAASANAADLYVEGNKEDPGVSLPIWSGPYAGVNGGYAFDALGSHGGVADNGGFGGGQIGYNWQGALGFSPRIVLGIEADFEAAGIDHTGPDTIYWDNGTKSSAVHHRALDDFGTVRGRIGYSFDQTLAYLTGGFAYGGLTNTFETLGRVYSGNAIESGYVLGGGVEYKFAPAWSLKAEYQFIDLGNSHAFDSQGGYIRTKDTELDTVRGGINYHLATGDPLAADVGAGGLKDADIPATTWAGLYIGGNGGYAWGTGSDADYTVFGNCRGSCVTKGDFTQQGGFGGGQAGYNWQRDSLVYGLEADIQAADVNGDATVYPALNGGHGGHSPVQDRAASALDWFGTVRGRLGVTVFDHGLVYATGGFAYGGVRDELIVGGPRHSSSSIGQSVLATGYAVGGGAEYAFGPEWSLKAEYQYIDLGSEQLSAGGPSGDFRNAFNTVRAGLNYHIAPAYEPLK